MADIRDLLNHLAAEEENLRSSRFLAPCVGGGQVRTNVARLLYTFTPRPREFEGWGIFQPISEHEAEVVEEAGLARVTEYLSLFPVMRLRLGYKLRGRAWIAYPANESDMRQRFPSQRVQPVPVHLVAEGQELEQVIARNLGGVWWFEEIDRRASPVEAESLREALRSGVVPEAVSLRGLTPEMRACYSLVFKRGELERERKLQREQRRMGSQDEDRLRGALSFGGGDLRSFQDRGDYWLVQWIARGGELHTSAIAKTDLTVISAGICLSGEDQKFDLQSLVGVVEGEW
jgi:hypothetical protein